MNKPQILVGVTSCRKHKERRAACRDTWMKTLADGVRPVFFVGGGYPLPEEDDVIALDCPDTYDELPAKIRAFFLYALEHESFDWLLKCDDDTYVVQDRLHDLTTGPHELVGNSEFLENSGYASGGAGYLLSRRVVELVANDKSLPDTGCEDIIITKAALAHGAVALATPRLVWTVAPSPKVDNDIITCHWCSPRKMDLIHAELTDEIYARFNVLHRNWSDQIYLYKAGAFSRTSSGCAGRWHLGQNGELHLAWFDWAEEVVTPDGEGYSSKVMRMTPAGSNINAGNCEKEIVVRVMGGLGNQLFQYAHGFALAKKLGATLKIAHIGWSLPFALDNFGLHLSDNIDGDIPIISDESGYTPGMVNAIRDAVRLAMNPAVELRGYFQNELFFTEFKNEIRHQLRPPTKLLPEYGNRTPVCVHVRRGDFVGHPLHDVCTLSYYTTARKLISGMIESPCYVINSNDLAWCKEHMADWPNAIFYESTDEYDAFSVMCSCKAFIIPNSTFGWWAAWLSGQPIVIRPDRFLNNRSWDIGPNYWIRVPGEGVMDVTQQLKSREPFLQRARIDNQSDNPSVESNITTQPSYRVFSYRNGGNLGDTIQTLALAKLLPGPLEGVYRDSADFVMPGPTFVVNGYLSENTPYSSNCLFAGVYIGGRESEQLEWIRQSSFSVGARDPSTHEMLRREGIQSEMIGCVTLTLPKYTGSRRGCVKIDDLTLDCGLTQIHDNLDWQSQCEFALERLDLLRTAELVVTSRLHVVLPCLAFGTPVMIPANASKQIFQLDRLSLLDLLGFEYGKPNVIDVSEYSKRFIAFMEHNLKITINPSSAPIIPDSIKWAARAPH